MATVVSDSLVAQAVSLKLAQHPSHPANHPHRGASFDKFNNRKCPFAVCILIGPFVALLRFGFRDFLIYFWQSPPLTCYSATSLSDNAAGCSIPLNQFLTQNVDCFFVIVAIAIVAICMLTLICLFRPNRNLPACPAALKFVAIKNWFSVGFYFCNTMKKQFSVSLYLLNNNKKNSVKALYLIVVVVAIRLPHVLRQAIVVVAVVASMLQCWACLIFGLTKVKCSGSLSFAFC